MIRPEANVQTPTVPDEKDVEVNELPVNTAPTSIGVDNEDEIFVYPSKVRFNFCHLWSRLTLFSKPKFTTSLTRRASVCTEIMHEEDVGQTFEAPLYCF